MQFTVDELKSVLHSNAEAANLCEMFGLPSKSTDIIQHCIKQEIHRMTTDNPGASDLEIELNTCKREIMRLNRIVAKQTVLCLDQEIQLDSYRKTIKKLEGEKK